jgi:hypothetical protein
MHPSDSACSLAQLPQELLDYIIGDLPSPQDISNLSQSCKALHIKTIERLYNHISLTWKASDTTRPLTVDSQHAAQSLRPNLLLQTILAKPRYAQSITHLKLQSTGFRGYWSTWGVLPRRRKPLVKRKPDAAKDWTTEKQRLAMDTVHGVRLGRQHDRHADAFTVSHQSWYDAVLMYDLDATIALLICTCSNLASLHLGFHIGDDVVFIPRLLWSLPSIEGTKQFPRCGNLRKITLGYTRIIDEDEEESDMWSRIDWLHPHLDWKGYWAFFWCPIIQTIEMNLMDEVAHEGFQMMEFPPLCSKLTTLRLYESSVTPNTLAKLLSYSPALKTLDYEYWTTHEDSLDCGSLNAAFDVVKSTLEHLRFVSQMKSPTVYEDSLVSGMCSFHDFPVLSSLQLPPAVLLGCRPFSAPRLEESIPSSMKKLCFTDDFFGDAWGAEELTSVLNDFVEGDWGASAPQLQQIYVAIDREWLGEAEDDCLRKLCEENGLKYEL